MRLALVLVVGCTSNEAVMSLAELTPHIEITVGTSSDPAGVLRVTIDGHTEVTADCPILRDDFTASIGDVEVPVIDRGGFIDVFDGANDCSRAYAVLDQPPPIAGAILTLADSSRTIECALDDALLPRAVEGPLEFAAGELATVRWSPAGDVGTHVIAVSIVGVPDTEQDAAVAGTDQIAFTIPNLPPAPYELHFSTRSRTAIPGNCGEVSNDRRYFFHATLPITIH